MVGKKIKERILFCDFWKLSDIHISVSINRVLLEHSPYRFHIILWHLSCYLGRVE